MSSIRTQKEVLDKLREKHPKVKIVNMKGIIDDFIDKKSSKDIEAKYSISFTTANFIKTTLFSIGILKIELTNAEKWKVSKKEYESLSSKKKDTAASVSEEIDKIKYTQEYVGRIMILIEKGIEFEVVVIPGKSTNIIVDDIRDRMISLGWYSTSYRNPDNGYLDVKAYKALMAHA